MIINYIKLAIRNLLRYKGYSLINILGLAVGLAASLIIILFVSDELSYDKYHEKSDRIFRLSREWFNDDGSTSLHLATVAAPIGPLLKNDYPDIILESVRMMGGYEMLFRRGETVFIEARSYFADSNYFKVFSDEMIKGDPLTALKNPYGVILSESTARRYFGEEDPMGGIIEFDSPVSSDVVPMKVTGIMKDPRHNSHVKIDILASIGTIENFLGREHMTTNWSNNMFFTYLLLQENYKPGNLQLLLPEFLNRHLEEEYSKITEETGLMPCDRNALHIINLGDIHLYSHLSMEAEANGNSDNVYLFSIIAFIIVLIACINYMNLSTARAGRRAKEIGLRKVMGADKRSIRRQFLGETFLVSMISLILALIIVEIMLPFINEFLSKELTLFGANTMSTLIFSGMLILITSILAGMYPAFYLSSFRPYAALKYFRGGGSGNLRKVLVVTQFSLSIALIIGVTIVFLQVRLMKNKDLGFNSEQILIVQADQQLFNKIDAFKSEVVKNPDVLSVTMSSLIPSDMLVNNHGGKTLEGGEELPFSFRLAAVETDYDYFDTYDIEMIAGRAFSKKFGTDDSLAFIINKTAVEKLGWKVDEAVGKPLMYGGRKGRIIGVTGDFHFESLHNQIVPVIFRISRQNAYRLSIRTSGERIKETISYIENLFSEIRPGYPFTFTFLDEKLNELYEAENKQVTLLFMFSILSIFVSCLGLFGLASFTAEQRTREIGIRKVFGATTGNVVTLLSREFLKWVLLANIVAWPLSWFLMREWLSSFAYRVDLSIWIFLFAGITALVISTLTVSIQAIRAANSNPVSSIRYE